MKRIGLILVIATMLTLTACKDEKKQGVTGEVTESQTVSTVVSEPLEQTEAETIEPTKNETLPNEEKPEEKTEPEQQDAEIKETTPGNAETPKYRRTDENEGDRV